MKKSDVVLQLTEVVKVYKLGEQTITALNNVDLTVFKGEFVAIMGSSGAGKSTMLQIASLLDNPTSGHILLHNQDVSSYSEKKLAKIRNQEIGFVFQQFNLLNRTSALENVALPLIYTGVSFKERQRRATKILEEVGLGDRLHNTPNQLSGGQQQRVAIARALVNDPTLLFADEPTGNLDSKSGEEIMDILSGLHKQGRTIVMVTHEEDIANYAQRVIRMQDGKILFDRQQKPKKSK